MRPLPLRHPRTTLILGLAFVGSLAASKAPRRAQQGTTYSVRFDDPTKSGDSKIVVKVSYEDAAGKKREKSIEATVEVESAWSADDKKTRFENALDEALGKEANRVDGKVLVATGGTGNVMTATPSASVAGSFSSVKLEELRIEDKLSGEKDVISKPGSSSAALACLQLLGDIGGATDAGGSGCGVRTNRGDVHVDLTPEMRKLEVLDALRAGLELQGARTWLDSDRDAIYVLLDGDVLDSLGAGSTDRGLTTICGVLAP